MVCTVYSVLFVYLCVCVQMGPLSAGGWANQETLRRIGAEPCQGASNVPVACRQTALTPTTTATAMPTARSGTVPLNPHTPSNILALWTQAMERNKAAITQGRNHEASPKGLIFCNFLYI